MSPAKSEPSFFDRSEVINESSGVTPAKSEPPPIVTVISRPVAVVLTVRSTSRKPEPQFLRHAGQPHAPTRTRRTTRPSWAPGQQRPNPPAADQLPKSLSSPRKDVRNDLNPTMIISFEDDRGEAKLGSVVQFRVFRVRPPNPACGLAAPCSGQVSDLAARATEGLQPPNSRPPRQPLSRAPRTLTTATARTLLY